MENAKTDLFEHSEVKVKLLGEYLERYFSVISNDGHTKRIHYFDLFCGEGTYPNGKEGSPLVALRKIKAIHYNRKVQGLPVPPIDCLFNDLDPEKVNKTRLSILDKSLHYPELGNIEFSTADYQEKISELSRKLPHLRNEKALVFIDPYGYKNIKAEHIQKLLASKNTEVLLWLPAQFMYRFLNKGTPEVLDDFVKELILEEKRTYKNVWEFVVQLKESFQQFLSPAFFVDTFTIEKGRGTLFCLFFFTSHIKGFEKMLEAKWRIDKEQGRGWNPEKKGPSLYFDQKTKNLEDKLLHYLASPKTNSQIYEFTLRMGFLPRHANEIFKSWQLANRIIITNADGTPARKGSFYIGYENYSDKGVLVTYTLNKYSDGPLFN